MVRAGTVFTTHTPVPAGIDRFDAPLVERYFSTDLLPGIDPADVLALGAEDYEGGTADTFNMAVMGLRLAQRANGVSQLHGEVSRQMFGALWPGFDSADVPITSVTNGVHAATWTDPQVRALAASRLGTDDTTAADWTSDAVSDAELWALRGRLRSQLVDDARRRMTAAWDEQNPGVPAPPWYRELLDPGRAHHRIRASRAHLQAAHPDAAGPGAAARAAHPPRAARCSSSWPASRIRPTTAASASSSCSSSSRRTRRCAGASCSCPTTTSAWRRCCTRAPTCGSTTRCARSRRAAPPA